MDAKTVRELSEIERKTLAFLTYESASEAEIAQKSGLNIDAVRRAANWLSEKGLAAVSGTRTKKPIVTRQGKEYADKGLPEQRMLSALEDGKSLTFSALTGIASLNQQEFSIALGSNKRKNFVAIVKDGNEARAVITEAGKEFSGKEIPEQATLRKLANGLEVHDEETIKSFIPRGIIEEKEESERKISITAAGKSALGSGEFSKQRAYNIQDPVPEIFVGKKQPYIQFLNIIRRRLTELGFKEMESPLIVHEFYNFDALFQPQNHPARTWTDTYQLKAPTHGKLTDRKSIMAIKAAHETGGVSASSGWGYTWIEEIASKVMPAAHGTAHSARQLTKGVQVPGKYFTIARCFRPDVLDATHLIEFNQTDGFIVGEDLNFRHLLGVLEQFAKEIAGAQEVKFLPDYYPFTEPSVQLSAKHPQLGWVELGGAGMFRPEMLENLGIKGHAIAWGIGIDRLAMFKLGIRDIRHLFSDDLNWLRKMPLVREV